MKHLLVGIDGSSASKHVLSWALVEAHRHNARVTAVLVAEPPYLYGSELPPDDDTLDQARAELEKVTAPVLDREHHVPVDLQVESGDPRRVLRDLSRDADLLVVGSRGHGELTGLLLGSVGQYLVTHAHCPVTVIRPRERAG